MTHTMEDTPDLTSVAVTYTFVFGVLDPTDEAEIAEAAEAFTRSAGWAFSDPVSVEVLSD